MELPQTDGKIVAWAERCLPAAEDGVRVSRSLDEVLEGPVAREEWEPVSRQAFRALFTWCEGRVEGLRAELAMPLTLAPELARPAPALTDWQRHAHEREAPPLSLETRAAYGARPRTGEDYSRSVHQPWFRPSSSRIACWYCVSRTEDDLEHDWQQYSRSFVFAQFPLALTRRS
jgi:hypothetical protein